MPRPAKHVVRANVQAIRKVIKDQAGNKQKEFRVGSVDGLVLMTGGNGVFYFFFRHDGRQRKMRLGDIHELSLATATQQVRQLSVAVGAGEDPRGIKARGITFEQLATKFLDEGELRPTTKALYRQCYMRDVFPAFGAKPAANVTPDDILAVCRKVKARDSLVMAQKIKIAVGGAFSWGKKERYVKSNPASQVAPQAKPSVRTRTPTDAEIAALWKATGAGGIISPPMKLIIRLTILTGLRRNEVAGVRVSELDLPGKLWIIPGDEVVKGKTIPGRTKNGREHHVYLTEPVIKLFEVALRDHRVGDIVFPSKPGAKRARHIHGESVSKAIRRLRDSCGVEDVTVHDMRRAVAKHLKDAGYSRDVRDLIQNHIDDSVDARHYSADARMEAQCRAAWKAWADHVLTVVGEKKPDASKKRTSKRFVQTGTVRSTIGVSDLVSKVSQSD